MALVTRDASASIDASTAMYAMQITGLVAGEDLDALAAVVIKAADGKVYMANATEAMAGSPTAAEAELARFIGIVPRECLLGQPVTIYGIGTRLRYAAGSLTPGAKLYVGATAGRFDDAATDGDDLGVARVIDDSDILITRIA